MTSPLKKYNILFWDLDGTLTDPMQGITNSICYALSYFGIEEKQKEKLIPFIGPPLKDSFMSFYNFTEEKADLAVKKYREYYAKTGLYENKMIKGIVPLLSCLQQQNKIMYIATSKPTVFARKVADHFGITQYFKDICGSELDGSRSTKDSVIAHILNHIDPLDKTKILMIGDRMYDIIGSKNNGIDSLGVLFGYGSKEELVKYGATYLAHNLDELKTLLQ
jgi:phosphoglycolate phosphatase